MPDLFDDFNRAGPGLGANWDILSFDTVGLQIVSNVLEVAADDWGDARWDAGATPFPLSMQFDFWVPDDPADGYHAYNFDGNRRFMYIENSSATPATKWSFFTDVLENNPSFLAFEFDVTGNTWYRFKARVDRDNDAGAPARFKIWKISDPEPVWTLESYYQQAATAGDVGSYLYVDTSGSIYPGRMDNFIVTEEVTSTAGGTFTGAARIHRPASPSGSRIKKSYALHILDHRPRPLPTYLPPKIPDEKEAPEGQFTLPCLPPCPGAGGGWGTDYGVNGGATVYTVTHCTSGSCAERYFNSGDGWLGKGDITSSTHCDCDISHSQSAHVNRMWISYTNIPSIPFRMRAKMIWDVGSPPNATVSVYANSAPPPMELGECDSGGAYWDDGNFIGRLSFSADGNGTIGGRSAWFQTQPSSITIDPNAISTSTFRFALDDEGQYYHAEFKSSTADIVTD